MTYLTHPTNLTYPICRSAEAFALRCRPTRPTCPYATYLPYPTYATYPTHLTCPTHLTHPTYPTHPTYATYPTHPTYFGSTFRPASSWSKFRSALKTRK